MKTTIEFLDELKLKRGGISDYAVAKLLGMTTQAISKYRTRRYFLGDETAIRVAELLEMDPSFVMACVHFERAKTQAERTAWQNIIMRIRGSESRVSAGVEPLERRSVQRVPRASTGDRIRIM